ncbi:PilN domain-containing protein [Alkalinema sp. FACHB-956]|uniref:PilN domain-containing protein n=1 Tax=Alkalinema sp. FACHB-956 TaxID=2692768 RepID=UPI001688E55A|nr:PilN domain-containing protein [Alkalinema sp. FACHB-956]MBD2327750.1 PilN domain-containing protein [Alkalinema sp. FACHB-956]
MYSLDINFLNDRPDLKPDSASRSRGGLSTGLSPDDKRPLYLGTGLMVLCLFGTLGAWGFLNWQNGALQDEQARLDSQLGNLEAKKKELAEAEKKVKAAEDEIQALASVFNQIKPWSAMAQDLRDRMPAGIQLSSITQQQPQGQQAGTAAANSPTSGVVVIQGIARSFEEVNDFLVVLQQSNFLKGDQTSIVSVEREDPKALSQISLPIERKDTGSSQTLDIPKFPGDIKFSIQTAVTEVPTADLVRELDRKGAVGLVSRIESLKNKGVIKP